MANAREEYLRRKGEYRGKRAMKTVTAPTGQEFKIIILDPMDIARLFDRCGIDIKRIREIAQEEIGTALLGNAKKILDEFVVPLVIAPKLIPSTVDPAAIADAIPVDWLDGVDQSFLINKLFEVAIGQEGKAAAESFPGQPVGQSGGTPGPDVRQPAE
jgi:hypothetical protein